MKVFQNIFCAMRSIFLSTLCTTVRGYKFNNVAINSTTAVAGKAGFTLASAVVEFIAKWSNLCPPTVYA